MMQPTWSWCATLTWPCGNNARTRQTHFLGMFHRKAQTRRMSSWPLTPSQAMRRKPRGSLANATSVFECFSLLSTVGGTEDNIFLYFGSICRQALIVPFTRGNMCVSVCVCVLVRGPLSAVMSSWWVYLTLPRNMGDVSAAISELKCGNIRKNRGKLEMSSL